LWKCALLTWLRRLWTHDAESFGNRGEHATERYLVAQGYRILARQHRNAGGELDLVALDGDSVVFVEVKTRRGEDHGQPVDAITLDKQRRLTRAALVFLKQRGWLERRCRFDVIAVVWPEGTSEPQITHYQNAFEPAGRGQMYS
jgi:putative endonuclease